MWGLFQGVYKRMHFWNIKRKEDARQVKIQSTIHVKHAIKNHSSEKVIVVPTTAPRTKRSNVNPKSLYFDEFNHNIEEKLYDAAFISSLSIPREEFDLSELSMAFHNNENYQVHRFVWLFITIFFYHENSFGKSHLENI